MLLPLRTFGSESLDAWGVLAALGGAVGLAAGSVRARRWVRSAPLLLFTGWQLVAGGAFLGVLSLALEGAPPALSLRNIAGYPYLALVGTGLAYTLWFRGIERVGVSISFLGLLSPVVATALGYGFLGERLEPVQVLGAVVILGSVLAGQWEAQRGGSRMTYSRALEREL